jgi:hypothetical protein
VLGDRAEELVEVRLALACEEVQAGHALEQKISLLQAPDLVGGGNDAEDGQERFAIVFDFQGHRFPRYRERRAPDRAPFHATHLKTKLFLASTVPSSQRSSRRSGLVSPRGPCAPAENLVDP